VRARICIGYTERTSVGNTEWSCVSFKLCSARFSALMIVLSDRSCEDIGKRETRPILKDGRSFRARLPGACVTKTTTLLGVSTATVSKVMSSYTTHRKTTLRRGTVGGKSTVTERDRRTLRIVSKNHTTTAAQVNCSGTEYSSWWPCFHKNCLTWASQIQHPQ
jgi:hypothetical protein